MIDTITNIFIGFSLNITTLPYLVGAFKVFLVFIFLYAFDYFFESLFKTRDGVERNIFQKSFYKSLKIADPVFYISTSLLFNNYIIQSYTLPQFVSQVIFLIFLIYIARIFENLVLFSTAFYLEFRTGQKSLTELDLVRNMGILPILFKIIIYLCAIVIYANFLGVQIIDLIATLGVSSIIIAFSLQSVLQDLFASLSVFLDKPFESGDYIQTETDEGTVVKVGFRSTRIRSNTGELIIIPNKQLSDGKVKNFKHIVKRKIFNKINICGQTDTKSLQKTISEIKEFFEKNEKLIFERVSILDISKGTIRIDVVFSLKDGDFRNYVDSTTDLNLNILTILEKNKIKLKNSIESIKI